MWEVQDWEQVGLKLVVQEVMVWEQQAWMVMVKEVKAIKVEKVNCRLVSDRARRLIVVVVRADAITVFACADQYS